MKHTRLAALALFLTLSAAPARAAVVLIDQYDNILAPDGVYALLYPNYYTAGAFHGSDGKKVADADFKLDLFFVRAIAYRHVAKIPLAFQVIVPFGRVEETSSFLDSESSGIGDLIFGPGVFLYQNEKSATYVSYWFYVFAPTGDFDAARPLNLGGNHWYFEHQLALNQTFAKRFVLDANLNFYHHTEEPDNQFKSPLRFEVAVIAGYQFTPKLVAGLHGGAYWDLDDTETAGVANPDTAAKKTALGPAVSYQITDKLGATFRWTYDVSATNDFKGNDLWLRFAYAF